jgi:membrane fusion protein (multidrug efflux system)
MDKKTIVAGVVVLGSLAMVAGGLRYWKGRAPGGPPGGGFEPFETVQVVNASTAKWRQSANLSGTVIALQSVTLANEVAGVVKEVNFESGQVVNAGDVLLVLDSSTEKAELEAAEATVKAAEAGIRVVEANIRFAEANLKRIIEARELKASTENDIDQAQAALDAQKATRERSIAERDQAKARVEQIRTMIAKKALKAPFKAVAGLRSVHPGQYLMEGANVVGLQMVSDRIYLDFALPQDQANRVKPGDVVMASAPAVSKDPLRIEVVAIDATADVNTRNVRIRSIVPNPDQRLRPGMFVDVNVAVDPLQDYTVVPTTAVRRASFGDHVFVIRPDPNDPQKLRAHQQFITLGPVLGNETIVLTGLKPGDEIAAVGSFKLREGVMVMKGDPNQMPQGGPGGGPPTGNDGSEAGAEAKTTRAEKK